VHIFVKQTKDKRFNNVIRGKRDTELRQYEDDDCQYVSIESTPML